MLMTLLDLVKWVQQLMLFTRHPLIWNFTSGFQKMTPLTQSFCFSSSASVLAAHSARGSGRPLEWVCSSEVKWCTHCGKGKPAYTSQSRWREGQSREQSVKEWQEVRKYSTVSELYFKLDFSKKLLPTRLYIYKMKYSHHDISSWNRRVEHAVLERLCSPCL